KREIQISGSPPHPFEQPKGAAIQVITGNRVRARVKQFQDGRHPREPRRESKPTGAVLKVGYTVFVGEPGRIDGAGIVKSFVHAGTLLDISRCLIDGRDDRTGGRIRRLSGVDGSGCKSLRFLLRHAVKSFALDSSGD